MPHSILNTLTTFPGTLANYQEEILMCFPVPCRQKSFSVYLFGSRARGEEEKVLMPTLAIEVEQINRCRSFSHS